MKSLLFTLEFPPFKGGVANYYENLVKHWPQNNEIYILNNNNNELISKYFYPKWFKSILRLYFFCLRNKIKHVIVGHILPLGTVTYFVSRLFKLDYSVILHGMDFFFAQKTKRKKFLTKIILNNAKKIICGNSYTAEQVNIFLEEENCKKISVVNPGINAHQECDSLMVEKIKQKYNLKNKFVLLSIGRMVKRKGFDVVVSAFKKIKENVPNAVYVLVGEGPDKEHIKKLSQNHEDIIFLGLLSDAEKWAWYCASDVFIMPARSIEGDMEGFGIVYLEANLAGKPVIAGDSGGVRDAVCPNFSGILVDPEKSEDVVGAVVRLAKDEALRVFLGQNGQKRALKEFDWSIQIKKIHTLIND